MSGIISITTTIRWGEPRWDFHRNAVAFADDAGPMLRDRTKDAAPVGRAPNDPRPGRLKNSIRYSRQTGADSVEARIEAHTPYAGYVVSGTAPHLIRPRAAHALHWLDTDGRDVFSRLVHHPGTSPNRFPQRALDAARPEIDDALRRHFTGGL